MIEADIDKLFQAIDNICKRRVAIMLKANGLLTGAKQPPHLKGPNDASYVREIKRLLTEAFRVRDNRPRIC
jgi:hypothetical protein